MAAAKVPVSDFEELDKLEKELDDAVKSKNQPVEKVTDTYSEDVDGLKCLETLAQVLDMLCTTQRENVKIRQKCNSLESNVRDLQSLISGGKNETKSVRRGREDGSSLETHSMEHQQRVRGADRLHSLDSALLDSRGSGGKNWLGKVKTAIKGSSSSAVGSGGGESPLRKLSTDHLHAHKAPARKVGGQQGKPVSGDPGSDQEDTTASFQQREVSVTDTLSAPIGTGASSDFGGVWLGPGTEEEVGGGGEKVKEIEVVSGAALSPLASRPPRAPPASPKEGRPSDKVNGGTPPSPLSIPIRSRAKSRTGRADSEWVPHCTSPLSASFDEADSQEKVLNPWPLLQSSSSPASSPVPAVVTTSPSPITVRKPKRSSTIGLGESTKHRKSLKEVFSTDGGGTNSSEAFRECLEKSMSKEFMKKMESWNTQGPKGLSKDDDAGLLPSLHVHGDGRGGHPPLTHTTSASAVNNNMSQKHKGRPSRFKDKVKREWEKRRSKSKDRIILDGSSMANRSKSCERPVDLVSTNLTEDFEHKLREWSMKKGKDPDYYTASPRPRCGSMPKSAMEKIHPANSNLSRRDSAKARHSPNLLSPDSAANWGSKFLEDSSKGAEGRKSRSRARGTAGSSQGENERDIPGKGGRMSRGFINTACYSSDESPHPDDRESISRANVDDSSDLPSAGIPGPAESASSGVTAPAEKNTNMTLSLAKPNTQSNITQQKRSSLEGSGNEVDLKGLNGGGNSSMSSPPPLILVDGHSMTMDDGQGSPTKQTCAADSIAIDAQDRVRPKTNPVIVGEDFSEQLMSEASAHRSASSASEKMDRSLVVLPVEVVKDVSTLRSDSSTAAGAEPILKVAVPTSADTMLESAPEIKAAVSFCGVEVADVQITKRDTAKMRQTPDEDIVYEAEVVNRRRTSHKKNGTTYPHNATDMRLSSGSTNSVAGGGFDKSMSTDSSGSGATCGSRRLSTESSSSAPIVKFNRSSTESGSSAPIGRIDRRSPTESGSNAVVSQIDRSSIESGSVRVTGRLGRSSSTESGSSAPIIGILKGSSSSSSSASSETGNNNAKTGNSEACSQRVGAHTMEKGASGSAAGSTGLAICHSDNAANSIRGTERVERKERQVNEDPVNHAPEEEPISCSGGSQDSGINVAEEKTPERQLDNASTDTSNTRAASTFHAVHNRPPITAKALQIDEPPPVHDLVDQFEKRLSTSDSSSTDTLEGPHPINVTTEVGDRSRTNSYKPDRKPSILSTSSSEGEITTAGEGATRRIRNYDPVVGLPNTRRPLSLADISVTGVNALTGVNARLQLEIPKKGTVSKVKAVFQNNPDSVLSSTRMGGTDFSMGMAKTTQGGTM